MTTTIRFCLLLITLMSIAACGEPAPECRGVATSCSALSQSQCDYSAGCYEDGSCGGIVPSCASHFSSGSCLAQNNCYWSYSTDTCLTAVATSCSTWSVESICESYDGCYYTPGCAGSAYSCDLLDDETSCGMQPGCSWE